MTTFDCLCDSIKKPHCSGCVGLNTCMHAASWPRDSVPLVLIDYIVPEDL